MRTALPRLAAAMLLLGGSVAMAQRARSPEPPAPPVEAPPPAYEPQLLRLSEVLGAVTHLSELCRPDGPRLRPEAEGEAWRSKMAELMEAESIGPAQKERLAGAYNRGLDDYRITYRICTPAGQEALRRLLAEGGRLAHELGSRFGS